MSKYNPSENWTDAEWNTFQTWLLGVLACGAVVVNFTKQDGSVRIMNCTLDPSKFPPVEVKSLAEGKLPRKASTTSIRVFDLDKKEWRSFTTRNVNRVNFSLGPEDDKV